MGSGRGVDEVCKAAAALKGSSQTRRGGRLPPGGLAPRGGQLPARDVNPRGADMLRLPQSLRG